MRDRVSDLCLVKECKELFDDLCGVMCTDEGVEVGKGNEGDNEESVKWTAIVG